MVAVKAGDAALLQIEMSFRATRHLPACLLFSAGEPSPNLAKRYGFGGV